jgi:hypothetical protein
MHPLCNVVSLGFFRVMSAVASLGEGIERSPLWPHVGRYVYMTSWILNYKPGNTTEPAHCESCVPCALSFVSPFYFDSAQTNVWNEQHVIGALLVFV